MLYKRSTYLRQKQNFHFVLTFERSIRLCGGDSPLYFLFTHNVCSHALTSILWYLITNDTISVIPIGVKKCPRNGYKKWIVLCEKFLFWRLLPPRKQQISEWSSNGWNKRAHVLVGWVWEHLLRVYVGKNGGVALGNGGGKSNFFVFWAYFIDIIFVIFFFFSIFVHSPQNNIFWWMHLIPHVLMDEEGETTYYGCVMIYSIGDIVGVYIYIYVWKILHKWTFYTQ